MPYTLVPRADAVAEPVDTTWLKRFDPAYWTVDFPRPMMASATCPDAYTLRIDTVGQRERIAEEAARSAGMLRTIDRTIAELEGDRAMNDAELYSGIVDPKKQEEYETWLEEKYGPDIRDHVEIGRRKMGSLTENEKEAMMSELKDIEQDLAAELRDGTAPESRSLDPLIKRHYEWIKASWGQEAPISAYAGLADTYLAHPDFVARYDRIQTGFAEFLATAMRSWASHQ